MLLVVVVVVVLVLLLLLRRTNPAQVPPTDTLRDPPLETLPGRGPLITTLLTD